MAKGIDPREERKQAKAEAVDRAGETFEAVANDWWEFKAKRLTNAAKGSAAQSRRYLDKDLIPALGPMHIGEIRRAHTLAAVQRLEGRGALHVAEKCRGWLNEIFRYAIARGLIEVNPAADLDVVAALQPPVQHNPILRRHELVELLTGLRESKAGMLVKGAIRLMLLTMDAHHDPLVLPHCGINRLPGRRDFRRLVGHRQASAAVSARPKNTTRRPPAISSTKGRCWCASPAPAPTTSVTFSERYP